MHRRRAVVRDRMHWGPKLPRGAGAVRCEVCGAVARSTGDGRPIVLPCRCHREETSTVDKDNDRLLTPGEVAEMFRVDPKTVTRWAAAGRISSTRTLGGHRRYRESEVRALLDGSNQERRT